MIAAAILTMPVNAERSGLIDPTRPDADTEIRHTLQAQPSDLKLESILVSPNRRVVVINGQRLAEGESADGIEVHKITSDTVAIYARGKQHLLKHKALPEVKHSKESDRYVSSL